MEVNILGFKVQISRELAILLIPLILIVAGICGLLLSRNENAVVFKDEKALAVEGSIPADKMAVIQQQSTKPEDEIKVYVVGCVNNPGIVTLKKGQMIDDAIRLAGGPAENADLANINLVYRLKENVTLKILPIQIMDVPAGIPLPALSAQEVPALKYLAEAGTGVAINTGIGNDQQKPAKVNINKATIDQLDSLPGIGQGTALDIIAFREKNGDFKTINDIMKVAGIKDNRFSKIKELITAD